MLNAFRKARNVLLGATLAFGPVYAQNSDIKKIPVEEISISSDGRGSYCSIIFTQPRFNNVSDLESGEIRRDETIYIYWRSGPDTHGLAKITKDGEVLMPRFRGYGMNREVSEIAGYTIKNIVDTFHAACAPMMQMELVAPRPAILSEQPAPADKYARLHSFEQRIRELFRFVH